MATSGKLTVHVLEARLLRDTDTFGKMDIYILFATRMQRIRTKTCKNGGKTPKWDNEHFEVDVKYIGDDMQFKVMDQDPCSSDLVGDANIKLSSLCMSNEFDDWFKIFYQGKEAGSVHLKSIWEPTGAELVEMTADVINAPPPQIRMSNGEAFVPGEGETMPPANVMVMPPPQQMMQQPMGQPGMMPPQQMQQPPMGQPGMMPPQQMQQPMGQPGMMPPQQMGQPGYPQQQMPGQYPGQYPGQQAPGQYPGQQAPGQYPGQQMQGQYPGQYPGQQMPGQYPPQQMGGYPGQQMPGQYPPQQMGGYPGQQMPGQYPPQQMGGYPGQQMPGQYPPQQMGGYPGQQMPGQYPPQQMGGMGMGGPGMGMGGMLPYEGNHMWKGFYHQMGDHPMEMMLNMRNGEIRGEGQDQIGRFRIEGLIIIQGMHTLRFKKEYFGQHTIHYEGHFEACHTLMKGHWGMHERERNGHFELRKMN